MFLICDEEGHIIEISNVEKEGAVDISGSDVVIKRGSIYNAEKHVVIAPDGEVTALIKVNDENGIRLEEV